MPAFLVRSQDIRLHGTIFGSIFVCLSTALLRRTSIPLGNCALMDSAAFLTESKSMTSQSIDVTFASGISSLMTLKQSCKEKTVYRKARDKEI